MTKTHINKKRAKNTVVSRPEPDGWDWNGLTAEEYAYIWADSRSPRWIFTHECEREILAAREKGSSIDKKRPDFFKDENVQRLILVIRQFGPRDANDIWHERKGKHQAISDTEVSIWHNYVWKGGDRPKVSAIIADEWFFGIPFNTLEEMFSLHHEDFDEENGYQAFVDECHKRWNGLNENEKLTLHIKFS